MWLETYDKQLVNSKKIIYIRTNIEGCEYKIYLYAIGYTCKYKICESQEIADAEMELLKIILRDE